MSNDTHPTQADGSASAEWYFDFISPFAYLQLSALAKVRERIALLPRPILFAAMLDHHGHKGPAEILPKRRFTYRFVQWQADRLGIALKFPPAHPFNPLPALRLAIAGGAGWPLIEAIFEHIWRHGRIAGEAADLAEVAARFGIADVDSALANADVKAQLRANTDQAIVAGVFGVPTIAFDDELFWGVDATPMFLDQLDGHAVFASDAMRRIDALPSAIARRSS